MVVPFLYSICDMRADDPGRRTGGQMANAINPLNAMPNPKAMPRATHFPTSTTVKTRQPRAM